MAVDMFLKIGDVKGEAKDHAYKEWIDVLAWSWGMSQSGTAHLGPGAGAGKVNVQDISVTKFIDASSPWLMLACCNGKHYPEATLVCRKAGEKPVNYLKVKMTDVMITAVSDGGSGGEDRFAQNVTINFAKVETTYVPQNADGTPGTPVIMKWDIAQNTGGAG